VIDVVVPMEQEGTRAVVRSWLKQVGDTVAENDPIVELETDKVAVEVSAPASGVLAEILLTKDAEAVPGAVLGRIAPEGTEVAQVTEAKQPLIRPEPFDAAGGGAQNKLRRGAPAPSPKIRPSISVHPERPSRAAAYGLGTSGEEREERLSPSVKRALRQHNLDPAVIAGTGRAGRITRADVDRAVSAAPDRPSEGVIPAAAADLEGRVIPHDRMRLAIAETMARSLAEAPHVTAVFEADFSAIAAHRAKHKDAFAAKGIKLTYTAYLVAAAAEAMKAAPAINSRWHADRLELFADVNVGVGTALGDKGLIVPVVRRAQALSLEAIAAALDDLVSRARAEKLTSADVRGGTFTISNHGVSGSLFAAPIIINPPQSAILGVGKLEKRVVVREVDGVDTIQIRPMAYVSLTIDHRVVDAHQTNAWLARFVEVLETWPA
jgi:2-oxoglutarate dehydrogenase E2 component (dihydrolipoamide succinyltransferase)